MKSKKKKNMAILANQQTNKILKIKQTNKQTNLKILEAADIKLDLAVPSVSIYFLTRHIVDTLTFLQFLESTTIFCLGVFVLLCIFQKDSLLLLWPNPIHPAYYSPKITSSEGLLLPRILCSQCPVFSIKHPPLFIIV